MYEYVWVFALWQMGYLPRECPTSSPMAAGISSNLPMTVNRVTQVQAGKNVYKSSFLYYIIILNIIHAELFSKVGEAINQINLEKFVLYQAHLIQSCWRIVVYGFLMVDNQNIFGLIKPTEYCN